MSTTHLQNKTARPGSLVGYSYYRSDRRPASGSYAKSKSAKGRKSSHRRGLLITLVLLALVAVPLLKSYAWPAATPVVTRPPATHKTTPKKTAPAATPTPAPAAAAAPAPTNYCADNTLDELIVVSISQRHLWACQGTTSAYDSPVVTGIDYLAADLTPTGTYHIYSKQTDLTLTGSDSTGSWSDPVSYWMPFLRNQYGSYGFHDATWRAPSDFGNISPDSADASHGCVELPLSTAAWLYQWASVGTTVTIES